MSLTTEVWNELEGRYGSDVRAVVRYHPTDFDTEFRADLRKQYSEDEVQSIINEIIIDQISVDDLVENFYLGHLDNTVRTFEKAWLLICPDSLNKKSGFIVSIERADSTLSMTAVETVSEYLCNEIIPQV